jgi:small-conductance mechanosensitive channel/CRP-like cAMP-binding protein
MNQQLLENPTVWLLPLVYGLAVFVLLLLIDRLLRRLGALRPLAIPYLIGALALSLAVGATTGLAALGQPIDPTFHDVLLAVIVCSWGFVGLGLLEDLLIDRWARRQGAGMPRLMVDIGRALAFIVVILLTLNLVLHVQLSSIVISSTILTAVIGLALQDLLRNVIAGIALQTERPFEVGHWVEINRQTGRVVEMSWRATRVITVDGNYIIYPNANLATVELINYTLGSPVQAMHVQIALAPSYPPNLVKQVLRDAALASPDVCREPPPSIKLIQYGDYSVTYDVKFWLYSYDKYPEKRDAVMTSMWYHVQRAGFKLPTPLREVYMHQVDAHTEVAQQELRIEQITHALRQVDLFAVLDGSELHMLAAQVGARLYARGEVLARQGEAGDSFFIIRSGRVRIDVDDNLDDDIPPVTVNHLGPGEFFGEMALLTGAARGATVTAEQDTEVLLVARQDIGPLLQANPELPERLGEVLARRQEMNQTLLAARQASDAPAEMISRPSLVGRIRQLFGLNGRANGANHNY